MSLIRYTTPDRAQKIAKAATLKATDLTSNSFSANTSAAKTRRFLVHWAGRSEMIRLSARDRRSDASRWLIEASGTVRLVELLRAI